jgi:hypothetical protein
VKPLGCPMVLVFAVMGVRGGVQCRGQGVQNAVPEAFDERGLPVAQLARVVEYDVPDRVGNGTGELIVPLTTITDPDGDTGARADELAGVYHQRWEEETGNDQLKTHLRGPGKVLRSRLPDLVHREIWAYLIVHHAISALIARADWDDELPRVLGMIATPLIPDRRERTCPRAVKRARHNNYRIKQPHEPASTRHPTPATIRIHSLVSRAA